MLLCFQPCCVWNNNRVWMRWLFVAKGLSPAVTVEQSVAAEMLISHKQRLLSRSNAARPWASLSTCCSENLFNNSFNHCTNSFPDAVDRYFEFQMLASSLGSFFLINEKKNLCQAAWNTSVLDIFKPNIQITSIKQTLYARPLEHKGQAVQKNKHIWVKMNCSTYKPFILLSFFTCYLHQRGCSSAAVSATLGQRGGSELPSPVPVPWWMRYFRCHDYVTLLSKIC